MTREEFGCQLRKIRLASPVSITRLCGILNWLTQHLFRVENAKNNYAVYKATEYLSAIGSQLIATTTNGSQHPIVDNASAATFLLNARGSESAVKVAESIGVTTQGLRSMETQKSQCSIDMFLKLCDYYGITISFEPINDADDSDNAGDSPTNK